MYRLFLIIETVVSKDLRLRIIRCGDVTFAVKQAMGLIEVNRLSDIVGDDPVALLRFWHAVDLYRQQYRDSCARELAR